MLIDVSYVKRVRRRQIIFSFVIAKTRVLWELLSSLFGVSWIIPSSTQDTLLGWSGSFMAKDQRIVWKVDPLCIFWMIWKARECIVFREEVFSLQKVKPFFVHLLWLKIKMFL